MTSVALVPALQRHNGDSSAREYVSGARLDNNLGILRTKLNDVITSVGLVIRDDDTLHDSIVRLRNLHPEVLANFGTGGNTVNIYQSVSTASAISTSGSYNVRDTEFGAVGTGVSTPLSVSEAAAFNATFGGYGLVVVAGDERDWAAIQAALYKAANTGAQVYLPHGTYIIRKPLTLAWTLTPVTGQPQIPLCSRFNGDGVATIIKAYDIVAGRGAVEFLGESNGRAANIAIEHMQVLQDPSCNKYSFCLRLGDGYVGIHLHRVVCKGAQALSLRVGSSLSYAQLCFHATQCQFWSNWNLGWGSDTGLDVYSVAPESLGSYWDSCHFDACFFWGQVDSRAFSLKFTLCVFVTPPYRALPFGATVYLGTAVFDTCYFEDHLIGVATLSNAAPITTISIRDCHFSSNNNLTPPAVSQSSIQCSRGTYEHGPVTIESCRFGGTASFSDIDLYGPITVSVMRCCSPFGTINVPPRITPHGLVRLIKWNSSTEVGNDTYEFSSVNIKCPTLVGPVDITQNLNGEAANYDSNTSTGNAAYAARVVKAGAVELAMVAFAPTHAALANQVWLFTRGGTNFPMIFGVGGLESIRIDSSNILRQRNFTWLAGPFFSQTSSIVVGNTVTEFGLIGAGVGSITVPANELIVGRTIRYKARGVLSSTGGPTLRMRCKLGGVTIADTGAVAQVGTPTNAEWELDVELVVRTDGAGGTAFAQGHFTYNGVTVPMSAIATVAVNTTITNAIDITAQWGTAAAGDTITQTQCTPEIA